MSKYKYSLCLVKGGEVTVERMIGPDLYDDEIDECGYDIQDAGFYLTDDDGNEMEIDTDLLFDGSKAQEEQLNDEQYVKYVCWRTSEWDVESDVPLTAEDVIPVHRLFGDVSFIDFEIPKATSFEFNSSWDGKYQEILQEAANPTYPYPTDDD